MRKELLPVALLTFVNVIGFALLIPVMPFIVEKYNQNPIIYGVLLASYPAFQFLGAPILGSLSDKYGRRPILLISQLGTLLSWVVFGAAYFLGDANIAGISIPIIVIALSRIIDGVTGGNVSVANAYLADLTKPKERTKIYGMMGAVMGIGLLIGPAMGGFANSTEIEYLGMVILAFAISLVTLILMYFYLPESLHDDHHDRELEIHLLNEINIVRKIRKLKNPVLTNLFITRLFFAATFSTYTSTIVLHFRDEFSLNTTEIGALFLVLGTFLIINQGFVVKRIADKLGDVKTYYLGNLLLFVGLAPMMFAPSVGILMAIMYLNNLGFSSGMPTFKSIISSQVDKKQQGVVNGIDEGIFAIASAVTPILAGIVYSFAYGSSFLIFSFILGVPLVIIFFRTGRVLVRLD